MTERLYYRDAYLGSFDANVLEGGETVYLDRTAFYPTSGGQPHDVGVLGGARVLDVVDEGERIAHVLDGRVEEGPVSGEIDWTRRFDHMQQHTGQHVLSAVFADAFGHQTVSVHFGDAYNTLDLDIGSVEREKLFDAEVRANEIVFANLPVTVTFEDAGTAAGLRKPSERPGELRVIGIEGVDRSACGGTHVRRTGEIGPILLRRLDRVRGAARVEFICGMRAVKRARLDYDLLTAVASASSSSPEDSPARIAALAEQAREGARTKKRLLEELAAHRARALFDAAEIGDHVRWIVQQLDGTGFEEARALAHAVASLPGAAYVATCATPPRVLLATSESSGLDAGALLKPALAAAGGRGGGSARLAQGTVPDPAALTIVLSSLRPDRVTPG